MKYLVFFGKSEAFEIQAFDLNGYALDFNSNFPDFELLESRFLTTDNADNSEMFAKYYFNRGSKNWTLLKYYGFAQAHNSSRVEGSTIGVGIIGDCDLKMSHYNLQLLQILYNAYCNVSLERKKFKSVDFKDDSVKVYNAFVKEHSIDSFQLSSKNVNVNNTIDYIVLNNFSELDSIGEANGLGSKIYVSRDARHVERYFNLYTESSRLFIFEGGILIDVVKRNRERKEAEAKRLRDQQREAEARRIKEQQQKEVEAKRLREQQQREAEDRRIRDQREADEKRLREEERNQQQNESPNSKKKGLKLQEDNELVELKDRFNRQRRNLSRIKKYLVISVFCLMLLVGFGIYMMIFSKPVEKIVEKQVFVGNGNSLDLKSLNPDSLEAFYLNNLVITNPKRIEKLNPWLKSVYLVSNLPVDSSKKYIETLRTLKANTKALSESLKIKIDTTGLYQKYAKK
jgi:flagellar biosynthesis GTPase FlhF